LVLAHVPALITTGLLLGGDSVKLAVNPADCIFFRLACVEFAERFVYIWILLKQIELFPQN